MGVAPLVIIYLNGISPYFPLKTIHWVYLHSFWGVHDPQNAQSKQAALSSFTWHGSLEPSNLLAVAFPGWVTCGAPLRAPWWLYNTIYRLTKAINHLRLGFANPKQLAYKAMFPSLLAKFWGSHLGKKQLIFSKVISKIVMDAAHGFSAGLGPLSPSTRANQRLLSLHDARQGHPSDLELRRDLRFVDVSRVPRCLLWCFYRMWKDMEVS